MAKARPVPVLPAEPFGDAARRILAVRAQEFLEAREAMGEERGDIELLHDLRVASRRLRAVLEVFGPAFPKKRHGRVLKEVKDAADALGAARDLDVQIAFLETFLEAAASDEQAGVAVLIQRMRADRDRAYLGFRPALDRLDAIGFAGLVQELQAS
jgi:CHAD domain-containing protein